MYLSAGKKMSLQEISNNSANPVALSYSPLRFGEQESLHSNRSIEKALMQTSKQLPPQKKNQYTLLKFSNSFAKWCLEDQIPFNIIWLLFGRDELFNSRLHSGERHLKSHICWLVESGAEHYGDLWFSCQQGWGQLGQLCCRCGPCFFFVEDLQVILLMDKIRLTSWGW